MVNKISRINKDNFQEVAEECLRGRLFGRFITSRGVSLYTNDLQKKYLSSCVHYVFKGNYTGLQSSCWEYDNFGYSTRDHVIELGDIIEFEPLERYVFEFYSDPQKLLGCEIMRKLINTVTKFTANGKVIKSRYTNPD